MNFDSKFARLLACLFLVASLLNSIILCKANVLLLSLDGFRWDYLDIYEKEFPNLRRLVGEGSTVEGGLIASWVTGTFSSHRTILTGKYPESHGIYGNTFWAPDVNELFTKPRKEMKFWNWSEPIWKVAQDQGVNAGCISIVGCDVKEQQPAHAVPFTRDLTLEQFTDKAMDMFKDSDKPAKAVFYYFWEPDSTGHKFGPLAEEMKQKMIEIDSAVGYLMEQVNDLNKTHGIDLNLIILSDHGLIEVNNTIDIRPFVNESNTDVLVNRGNIVHIWKKDPEDQQLLERIVAAKVKYPNTFEMLPRWKIPKRLHFQNSFRCPPILLVAEPGITFLEEGDRIKGYQPKGTHGYYPEIPQMRPFFAARGPAFKSSYVHKNSKIETVDVFSLVAYLLKIQPGNHEGNLGRIIELLEPEVAEEYFFSHPKDGASLPRFQVSYSTLALTCLYYFTAKLYV